MRASASRGKVLAFQARRDVSAEGGVELGFFETTRNLSTAEDVLAKSVFLTFLPYGRILIGNQTGVGGAPWTQHFGGTFTLHVGPVAYADCTSSRSTSGAGVIRNTFIHELTHVWQGHHSRASGMYQLQSLGAQASALIRTGDRNNAYTYTAGAPWDSYNVEQQAEIVEDWSRSGMSSASPLYPYIRDHIRK